MSKKRGLYVTPKTRHHLRSISFLKMLTTFLTNTMPNGTSRIGVEITVDAIVPTHVTLCVKTSPIVVKKAVIAVGSILNPSPF